MMEPRTHRFIAVGFKEDFHIPALTGRWAIGSHVLDPKDYRVKDCGNGSTIYAYAFGALTFINLNSAAREREIMEVRSMLQTPITEKTGTEEFIVEEVEGSRPHVSGSHLVLDKLTPQRTEVIAMTLAQSAAMEYYESRVIDVWNKVSAMVNQLEATGKVGQSPRAFHRLIGGAMAMRTEVVGVLHMLDKPDVIWDDSMMDAIYNDLRAMFDLQERFQALEYKIDMIQDALELLVDMARDKRIYLAELTIILLIAFEIVMAFVRH
jgi:uncharacterized Rmd1/YagE family protein